MLLTTPMGVACAVPPRPATAAEATAATDIAEAGALLMGIAGGGDVLFTTTGCRVTLPDSEAMRGGRVEEVSNADDLTGTKRKWPE